MIRFDRRTCLIILIALLAATFIPFLGLTLFNTKGEPREAIVALSMLRSGNWILPQSYCGDIPYKPPFLGWCIALFSAISGGEVTHFASRLPSALAMIAMSVASYSFYCRRLSPAVALCAALVTMTAFEVNRAATACRVDMLLAAFVVLSLCLLYSHCSRGKRGIPWLAVLTMSCAVLTKGPVGMLLPCLVAGVYRLVRGERFFTVFFQLLLTGILACVVPALWYAAAYHQGGAGFLDLALEENFGRFMGRMSYESHVRPAYYNLLSLLYGLLPYTLLLLFSLFAVNCSNLSRRLKGLWQRLRAMDPADLFSLLSALIVILFYCIPKSKRSVYLLPAYPFIAYFIARLMAWLARRGSRALRIWTGVLGAIALMLPMLFLSIKARLIGFPAGNLELFVNGLRSVRVGFCTFLFLIVSLMGGAYALWRSFRGDGSWHRLLAAAFIPLLALYWSYSALYQPALLNSKSDLPMARHVEMASKGERVYSFIDDPYLRFYTINFYLGDRLARFDDGTPPASGLLLVDDHDLPALESRYGSSYTFTPLARSLHPRCDTGHRVNLLRFFRR